MLFYSMIMQNIKLEINAPIGAFFILKGDGINYVYSRTH